MVKHPVFKALKVSEPSSSPSPLITISSEKTMNYYGRFKGLMATENLMEEEGKGKTSATPKTPVFSPLSELLKGYWKEKERKRILYTGSLLNH